jgi:hypothetical protein
VTKQARTALCAVMMVWPLLVAPAAMAGPGGCRQSGFHAGDAFHLIVGGHASNGNRVRFYNFDFKTPTCARQNNVEWPVDVLFYDNASVSTVTGGLGFYFPYGGPFASRDYARINNGGRYHWIANRGRRTAADSVGTYDAHYRVYGYRGRNYAVDGLGFFVIATMHRDYNEGAHITNATYGDSEDAEHELWEDASSLSLSLNWTAYYDNYDMRNSITGVEGNHIWNNDGLATMVRIQ